MSIQKSIFIKPGKQKDNNIYMTFVSSFISTLMNESLMGIDCYVNGLRFMAPTELVWRLENRLKCECIYIIVINTTACLAYGAANVVLALES